jgi:two-component SAPR family response regulator
MLQTIMRYHPDTLEQAIEDLKQALASRTAGQESQWTENVAKAIANIQKKLRQHTATAQEEDGLFSEVDDTRPTLARQTDEIRREHSNLLGQLLALREEVHRAKETIAANAKSSSAQPGSVPQSPDLGAIRLGAEKLLAELQQNMKAETALLMESVNTDIGVGD